MICNTENCTTPATHTDWLDEPICAECVSNAVEFGESAGSFKPAYFTEGADISKGPQKYKELTATDAAEIIKDLGLDHHDTAPATPISDAVIEILNGAPTCTYDEATFCSCPECLLADRCTLQDCRFKVAKDITVFEETLTANGLEKIKKKALLMPAIAKTSQDYDLVYEFSTALKRAHVAARKKIKELKRDLKKQYDEAKGKIDKDLEFVLTVIDPILGRLSDSRDYMECWTLAIREQKARKIAAEQEAERVRLEQEAERLAAEEKARAKAEKSKLKQEKFEATCLESRLSFIEAFDDGEFHFAEWISQDQLDEMLDIDEEKATDEPGPTDSDIETLREFAKDEPAQLVETETFADEFTSTELPDGTIIVGGHGESVTLNTSGPTYSGKELSEEETQTIIDQIGEPLKAAGYEPSQPGQITAVQTGDTKTNIDGSTEPAKKDLQWETSDEASGVIYSTDPAEKELQLLEVDADAIKIVKNKMLSVKSALTYCEQAGFESQTATTATRALIAEIEAAAAKFSEAVTPAPTEQDNDYPITGLDDETEITEKDCPF